MALNFPDNPSVNQIHSDETAGFFYRWDGTVWQSFSPGSSNNIQTLDDVSSSFNGITTSFSLTSRGVSITPISSAQLVINLGGIVQDPTDDYAISGSNIIFSEPPETGLSFSGISLGPAIPISNIIDGTVVPQDLSTGGPWWQSDYKVGIGTTVPTSLLDVEGNVIIAGITTISAGAAGTALIVQGNARITGILTIGTSSITFDGANNTASIGTSKVIALPSGSATLWYQAAAPTGWTKVTTHHDKTLRIVNTSGGGSGGITTFTGVFRSRTPGGSVSGSNSGGSVSDTTLSTTQIPSHTHAVAGGNATGGSPPGISRVAPNFFSFQGNVADAATATGGGQAHGHGFTSPTWSGSFTGSAMDFDVQYVDMIIAALD